MTLRVLAVIHSFIHSLSLCSLGCCCVPGTVLAVGGEGVETEEFSIWFQEIGILVKEPDS